VRSKCKCCTERPENGHRFAHLTSLMSRILVVEDEPEIRENIQALLELEGHIVIPASNGREALFELEKRELQKNALQDNLSIDLILLDLSMPIMTGSEFLTEVAKNPAWAKIPVCITTGVAELPKFDRAVDILRKPISFQELMRHIHKSCHPSVPSAAEDVA
jgi:CheY-like chemotaxis protein